jgi:NitT/TauT family transport system substrate-binding protein
MRIPHLFLPIAVCLLSFTAACSRKGVEARANAGVLFPIKLQIDWVAEPEHGAFYTAEALGYFKAEGLDVEIIQGGANAYVQAKVATNQVQIGQSDSTNILLAIAAGAPLVNVGAIFQHDPSVFMMQEKNPVNTWKDLQGKTIMARPEWAFIPYLRKKYDLQFNVIPQSFDLGRMAVDPTLIQQGYYIAEPYFLEQHGIKLKFLHVWDAGFDSYTTIVTNRNFAREHPEQLRAFLRACYRGWKYYIETDGTPAHDIMFKVNQKVTRDYMEWSRRQIISAHLAKDEKGDYIAIDPERIRREIGQLEDLSIIPKGKIKAEDAVDTSFLPKPGL